MMWLYRAMKARVSDQTSRASVTRHFRDLTEEEIRDPEVLDSLATLSQLGATDWEKLLESERILLMAEAGAGKTFECQQQVARMIAAGDSAFFIPLEALSREPLEEILSPEDLRRFEQWREDGASTAVFFLDSIDEMRLSHGNFRTALRRLRKAIDGQLGRAKVVATSRPISVDFQAFTEQLPVPPRREEARSNAAEQFEAVVRGRAWRERNQGASKPGAKLHDGGVRIVALVPLSDASVREFVRAQGVTDADKLIEEIAERNLWDLARRPQDLLEICAFWREHHALGRRSDQVAQNAVSKLRENEERRSLAKLSDERAMEGAQRLALAVTLSRKRSIRISDNSLDDLDQPALDPETVLPDWSPSERAELFERPIFGFASYGRIRFHHRSVSEFLAAKRLSALVQDRRMPFGSLKRLLFGERYGEQVLYPATRATAVWLALWDERIFDEVLARNPEALVEEGDPESLTLQQRSAVLRELVKRFGEGEWRGLQFPWEQVRRFASPDLSPTVRELWSSCVANSEIQELLVDLILAGRMTDCADIARQVASDPSKPHHVRLTAIQALVELDQKAEIENLVQLAIDPSEGWPQRLTTRLPEHLFPEHLDNGQLCSLLRQSASRRYDVGGYDWSLPRLFDATSIAPERRSDLIQRITDLIYASAEKTKDWPRYRSDHAHLANGLATLCFRALNDGAAPEAHLMRACVAAGRFKTNSHGDDEALKRLRDFFDQAPENYRAAAYRAESDFSVQYLPEKDSFGHAFQIVHESLIWQITDADFEWLLAEISDEKRPLISRAAALQHALSLSRDQQGWISEKVNLCRRHAAGNTELAEQLAERIKPPKRDKKLERMEKRNRARQEEHKRKEEARVEDWHGWRLKLIADPATHFDQDHATGTIANIWQVLEQNGESLTQRVNWDRSTVTELFGDDVASRAETAFRAYWRDHKIPLPSERPTKERNTYYTSWLRGLAGVYAEAAADPEWATKLSAEEAEIAARYAPLELNGLPAWLDALAHAHPAAVDKVLGGELSRQLKDARLYPYPDLLSDFAHGSSGLQRFMAPRVWDWLTKCTSDFRGQKQRAALHEHLEKALTMLFRVSPEGKAFDLARLARRKLSRGISGPFALLWANVLLRLAPGEALDLIERGLKALPQKRAYQFCVSLFAGLGERRNVEFAPNVSSDQFRAEDVLRLLRLAYSSIRREDDIERSGRGPYSPTLRDDAERGRDIVLGALMRFPGEAGWQVKGQLTSDPLFAHLKDRIAYLAREVAASDAEPPAVTEAEIRNLDSYGEAPPKDRDGMFQIMIDRIADFRDEMDHEFSQRPLLATIKDETVMQNALAKRFDEMANHAYRIDRESEVVSRKKTDVRFLSVKSDQQAVIEVKLANNGYSVADLIHALEEQLVGQYMLHDRCRAGCLLITINKDKEWLDPDTGERLSFEQVIQLLRGRAETLIRARGYSLRLGVEGLDLRTATKPSASRRGRNVNDP